MPDTVRLRLSLRILLLNEDITALIQAGGRFRQSTQVFEILTAYKAPSRLGLVPELPPSLVGNFSAPGFPLRFSASLTLSLIISLSIQIGCRGVNSMSSPAPQPSGGGGPVTTSSGVKHLIVVIMQNNSF